MPKKLVSWNEETSALAPVVDAALRATFALHGEGGVIESPEGSGFFVADLPRDIHAADAAVADVIADPASETHAALVLYDVDGDPIDTTPPA